MGGGHFSYFQAGLDVTIKTFISRIIDCLVLQTNAFIKILQWRNIHHSNLTKIIQHNSVLTKDCKKSHNVSKSRASHHFTEDLNAMYLSS